MKTPEEQHGYNRAFTDAIIALFGALASWELQDDRNDEDRDIGDSSAWRRQIRQDFATCLAEIPESVRHFELRFEDFGPANHAAVQPTAFVAQGTAPDALSEAL